MSLITSGMCKIFKADCLLHHQHLSSTELETSSCKLSVTLRSSGLIFKKQALLDSYTRIQNLMRFFLLHVSQQEVQEPRFKKSHMFIRCPTYQ